MVTATSTRSSRALSSSGDPPAHGLFAPCVDFSRKMGILSSGKRCHGCQELRCQAKNGSDFGQIDLKGNCLFSTEQGINLPPELRRSGYVFQDARLLPHSSVNSNQWDGQKLVAPEKHFIELNSVVEVLKICHLPKHRPVGLSGGEKHRVAIGRALLTSPSIFLMDEPLN